MTRANATEIARSGTTPASTDCKSVLVCPRCAHESTVWGDWILVDGENEVGMHCPDCRTQLAERPR